MPLLLVLRVRIIVRIEDIADIRTLNTLLH